MIGIDMVQQFSTGGCTTTNCSSISMNDASYIYYNGADSKLMSSSSCVTFKAPIAKVHFDVFEGEDTWWMVFISVYNGLYEDQIEVTDFVYEPDLMSVFDWVKIYYSVVLANNPLMYVDNEQEIEVYVNIEGEVISELINWGDIVDAYSGKDISEDQKSCEEDPCSPD